MAALRDEPRHLPREEPPLNPRQRRLRERQPDEAQIHDDHETGEGDDAGDVGRLNDRIAPVGLADRSRPGERLEPLEGGDDRGHRGSSVRVLLIGAVIRPADRADVEAASVGQHQRPAVGDRRLLAYPDSPSPRGTSRRRSRSFSARGGSSAPGPELSIVHFWTVPSGCLTSM